MGDAKRSLGDAKSLLERITHLDTLPLQCGREVIIVVQLTPDVRERRSEQLLIIHLRLRSPSEL